MRTTIMPIAWYAKAVGAIPMERWFDVERRYVERGSMEESIERLREVYEDEGDEDGNVTFAGGITLNVEDAGNYEVVDEDSSEDDEEGRSDGPRSDGQGDEDETNEEWFARFGIDG